VNQKITKTLVMVILVLFGFACHTTAQTVALWLFDEQVGIYPSCVLNDAGKNDYPLVLGTGGQIVPGKFGNALQPIEQNPIQFPEGSVNFGLKELPIPAGRTVEPMTWMNANFCALMTSGENHLRKEFQFAHPTTTGLNIGDFDWTIEFWFLLKEASGEIGVVFEIGSGPRGENDKITRLELNADSKSFTLINQPGGVNIRIPSNEQVLAAPATRWAHFAFVYAANENQIRHYVDGKIQKLPPQCRLKSLDYGEEDYMTIGRNGLWNNPLPGAIDELRFSLGQVYQENYNPPSSFSPDQFLPVELKKGLPLLFADRKKPDHVFDLGARKLMFVDEMFVASMDNVKFQANPPRLEECVIDSIQSSFRKHLSIIEDESGLLRLYYGSKDDFLAVMISKDGIRWEKPDLGVEYKGEKNIVIPMSSAMGNVFIDPNAPTEARWKYISGSQDRGIYVFYSADGWQFKRLSTPAIPVWAGSQSNVFWDDQQGAYLGYHRSDFGRTIGGRTQREFGMTIVEDLMRPWDFSPVSQKQTWEVAKYKRLRRLQPWFLDNGPLTPGGLGNEYPTVFAPMDDFDPDGTDIYVPKAIKYPWAPDTYLAFPLLYFHYKGDGPITRQILNHPDRRLGSGPVETQLAVSRDGVNWKRYPRPVYVGNGKFGAHHINQSYMGHGLVKRGDEIWQYFFGETRYHSSWQKEGANIRAVYRTVQRLDGFVSADTPYDKEGILITKPFKFSGNRLVLNIDTDATGYAQVGFLDKNGKPIQGFSVDDCVYINGDFIDVNVEWIKNQEVLPDILGMDEEQLFAEAKKLKFSNDVSELEGKIVQLVFRMRGAKLYAMQFLK